MVALPHVTFVTNGAEHGTSKLNVGFDDDEHAETNSAAKSSLTQP